MSAQDTDETTAMPDVPEMAASSLGRPGLADDFQEFQEPQDQSTLNGLPAWLVDADAEEQRELEALGVVAAPTFDAEAQRDELVSRLMRVYHEHEADVTRYDEAEVLEHGTITRRYDRLRAPAKRQMVRLGAFITHVVSGATFKGKKRSRSVGWGSYGFRKERDKVDLVNMPEVVAAVRKIEPQSVRVDVVTTAEVQEKAILLLTHIIDGTAQANGIGGTEAGILSQLRAQLRGGIATVTKPVVAELLKMERDGPEGGKEPVHVIPGASLTIGADKPWFEVEPPTDGN